jgi:hexulose-6-phosphate isomerase
MNRIGFMQGRLSPKPEGRIQAFPKNNWREEFQFAQKIGFACVELIYDELHLESNPLASEAGEREISALSEKSGVAVGSICADYFMIHPLQKNLAHAKKLLQVAKNIRCPLVELPFVDSSSLARQKGDPALLGALGELAGEAEKLKIRLSIESDLAPVDFRDYLAKLPANVGVNLDLGNSAALGYDARSECAAYGNRLFNVHIKDRLLGGTTVPLTTGHADFPRAFAALRNCHYKGDFILQTAPDPDYLGVAQRYLEMTKTWAKALWT